MKKFLTCLFLLFSALSFSENVIRKISVTGNSEREIMPDVAIISFQINVKNTNLSAGTKEANDRMEKFRSALKSKKIDLSELETVSFYTRKQKEYNNENEDYYGGYDEDVKGLKKQVEKPDKKPASYTGNLSISITETNFEQISALMDFSDGENIQSIQKNFEDGTFAFNINETDTSPEKTLNKVFSKFNSIRKKLQSLGISPSNILLGGYTFTENYNDKSNNMIDMHYVVHDFKIKIRNLKNLNTVISIADDNKININGYIQFDISDKDKIASEMYNEAFNQSKVKAESILKSSGLKLASPLVVSEDINFQQKMIDNIDQNWSIEASAARLESQVLSLENMETRKFSEASASGFGNPVLKIDYTPKPIKLTQNISVLYEMK